MLTDPLVTTIRAGRNVAAFLREIRENNEIMLQRDPESMKQKAFGVETRTPVAGVEDLVREVVSNMVLHQQV